MLALWNKQNCCYLCEGPLDYEKRVHLHHNHATGEVYGLTHPTCNRVEGQIIEAARKRPALFKKVIEILGVSVNDLP
jgi:hypothetical protein